MVTGSGVLEAVGQQGVIELDSAACGAEGRTGGEVAGGVYLSLKLAVEWLLALALLLGSSPLLDGDLAAGAAGTDRTERPKKFRIRPEPVVVFCPQAAGSVAGVARHGGGLDGAGKTFIATIGTFITAVTHVVRVPPELAAKRRRAKSGSRPNRRHRPA